VKLAPKTVTIYRLEVEEVDLPRVVLLVKCSQGTYIRTLAADLGEVLSCGAHLTALRRLEVEPFRVSEAVTLEALENMGPEDCRGKIIPLNACLPGRRQIQVGPQEAEKMRQGQPLAWSENEGANEEIVQVMTAGELLALARIRRTGEQALLTPVRVFLSNLPSAFSGQPRQRLQDNNIEPMG